MKVLTRLCVMLCRSGYESAAKSFNLNDMKDINVKGSQYVITGANSGKHYHG